ncbi:SPOR domain-containing protein [Aliishimia ponticola]|uniref:SPOR domain-containing protein n=1 Tax=Aliishimia ponticola TaxID=2499833 RepID=A0A4S4NCE2_9RHOB|nr:SPOR domain-containing protein [Aliishimia ponticola]THH37096.1 SPOR domain-containing protein [Aliishimia ponticola]
MKYVQYLAAVVGLLSATATGVVAQSSGSSAVPAETPPGSYTGAQYVDSKGCVFIRAGVDGNVTWIPRVNRQRQHICGMAPSQVAGGAAAEPAPVIRAAPKPVAPAAVAPAAAAPKPVPMPRAAKKVRRKAAKPMPRMVKRQTVAPAPTPVQTGQVDVYDGDQPAVAVLSRRALGKSVASTSLPGSTRVVPLHVARQQLAAGSFNVPSGYRKAWEDDRLNPRRAEGTLRGREQMHLVWTTGVPRRLIDKLSGRDVTAKVALVYPYTDFTRQRRELGVVTLSTRNGQVVKQIKRNRAEVVAKPAKAETPRAVQSTRSAAPAPKAARAESLAGKQYVQVGTFGVAANAQTTAARLKQMGLPMRIGKYAKNGKTYRIVLAGPFADQNAASNALGTVRRAGFGDAFLRK